MGDHPELSYCPLEKTSRTDEHRTNEGAFNIDSNTFHLPPLGALCDHPELSYSKKNFASAGASCRSRRCRPQKSKIYSNTFHLPPSGALCDHPELSYCPLEKTLRTPDKRTTNDERAFNI